VRYTTDGQRFEEPRLSKSGSALDEVKFEDHMFRTSDPELAALIRSKAGYGFGADFWSLEDEKKQREAALEVELRRMVEANPDIVRRVLKPSDKDDFELPAAQA
jgi:hypothetical protein